MSFLARIFRFLFWVLIASWAIALLRRLVGWMLRGVTAPADQGQNAVRGQSPVHDTRIARKLVRDPVCGMHISEELAIPMRENGELVHFCSAACRDQYLGKAKSRAANG